MANRLSPAAASFEIGPLPWDWILASGFDLIRTCAPGIPVLDGACNMRASALFDGAVPGVLFLGFPTFEIDSTVNYMTGGATTTSISSGVQWALKLTAFDSVDVIHEETTPYQVIPQSPEWGIIERSFTLPAGAESAYLSGLFTIEEGFQEGELIYFDRFQVDSIGTPATPGTKSLRKRQVDR